VAQAVASPTTQAVKTAVATKTAAKSTAVKGAVAPPFRLKPGQAKIQMGRPTRAELHGAVAWPQGFGWWAVYRAKDGNLHRAFFRERPPDVRQVEDGPGEAYRGIQKKFGEFNTATMDMGFMQVGIDSPSLDPGRPGAITFLPVRLPSTGRSVRITPRRPKLKK